jgi:hypothetical protein
LILISALAIALIVYPNKFTSTPLYPLRSTFLSAAAQWQSEGSSKIQSNLNDSLYRAKQGFYENLVKGVSDQASHKLDDTKNMIGSLKDRLNK